MNRSIIKNSVVLCFKKCPFDSILLLIVSTIISLFPALILQIYNCLLAHLQDAKVAILLIFCYCFFSIIQRCFYNYYHHYYLNYKSLLKFEKIMKKDFFKVCSKLNLEDYFLPEIVNETKRAQNASTNIFRVYQIIVEIIASIIGVALIGSIVFSIDRSLIVFLILTTVAPVADNIYQIIQKKYLLYKNTQKQKEDDEYIKLLTKSEHLKEIKLLSCFDFVFNKWLKIREKIILIEQQSQRKIFWTSLFFNLVGIGGTIGAYSSITVLFVSNRITIAQFSMTILTITQIIQFVNQLFSLMGNLSEFSIMVKPYYDFLNKAYNRNQHKKILKQDDVGNLVLKNISYKYPNSDSYALKNINLSIKQGEFVSIVGANGSGKTTLSKIILGLITPASGYIKANSYEMEGDLDYISYVPQAFNTYCISIKDNMLFGKTLDNDLLNQTLDKMGLTCVKEQIDELYGQDFGGIELSKGQKQRIAIIRATLKCANLFIFDEPTSAIDPFQEKLIYDSILEVAREKTVIMISHRLTLTKNSDLIIVLKDGEIIEMGNHENLIQQGGEYANMWKIQSDLYLS